MASKDDIIAQLRRIVDAQAKQIAAQAKRIDELELKLAKALKDSSKSPSSDIVKPPSKKQSAAGKGKKAKRGGQKGHKRKLREPLPPERVDEQITCEINVDCHCHMRQAPAQLLPVPPRINLCQSLRWQAAPASPHFSHTSAT